MSAKEVVNEMVALLSDGPLLPGGVKEHYNVCGKKNCRCKAPEEPVLHGPYAVLSSTISGRSVSLNIGSSDREAVEEMVGRFRTLKGLLNNLALEYVDGFRVSGIAGIKESVPDLVGIHVKSGASEAEVKRLAASRDKWKKKALDRQALLQKNRITIRDLGDSRQKWRCEALASRERVADLNREVASERSRANKLADEAQYLNNCMKKNG